MYTMNEFAAASLSRPRETLLQKLQNEARKDCPRYGRATAEFEGKIIEVRLMQAMINRGRATGTCERFTYYVDGTRTAFDKVYDMVRK